MKGLAAGATITCFATLVEVLSDRNDYLELDQPAPTNDPCEVNCMPFGGSCDFFPPLGTKGEDICDTCEIKGNECKSSAQTADKEQELKEADEPDEEQPQPKKKKKAPPAADDSESESDFEKMIRICKEVENKYCKPGADFDPKKAKLAAIFKKLKEKPLEGWSCQGGGVCRDTRVNRVERGFVDSVTQEACMATFAPGVLHEVGRGFFEVGRACIPVAPTVPVPLPQPDPVPPPGSGEPDVEPSAGPAKPEGEQPAPAKQPEVTPPTPGEQPEVTPPTHPEQPEVTPPTPPEQPEVKAEPQAGGAAKVSAPPSPPAKSPEQVCEAILANKDTDVFCRKGKMQASHWTKKKVRDVTGFQQEPADWTCTKAYKCGSTGTVVKGNSAAACNGQPAERTCIPESK